MKRISLLAALLLGFGTQAVAAGKPNIVLFLVDDAGWGDYSHSGNTQVRTPHIDSLARGGVSLDHFFVQPVCMPTRAEFLTGRYHPRGGVRGVSTGQERLDGGEKTLADAFKAAGYATGAFGKWHNGSQWPYHPMARGFDEYFGHTAGHWGEYFDAPLEENGRMIRTQGYIVDICTDRALAFIEKNQAKPFLCYVPFTTPHLPWAAPAQDWQQFKDKPITQRATNAGKEVADETRCASSGSTRAGRGVLAHTRLDAHGPLPRTYGRAHARLRAAHAGEDHRAGAQGRGLRHRPFRQVTPQRPSRARARRSSQTTRTGRASSALMSGCRCRTSTTWIR